MNKSKELQKIILVLFTFSLSEIVIYSLLNYKPLIHIILTYFAQQYVSLLYSLISFLLYPLLITLPLFCGLIIFRILVEGWFAEPLRNSMNEFALGSFIYLMVANEPFLNDPLIEHGIKQAIHNLQPFGPLIIYSTIIIIGHGLVSSVAYRSNQKIPAMLSKALAMIFGGLVLRQFLSMVMPQGWITLWGRRELHIPVGDIVFIGILIAGITSLFYPLRYSRNRYLSFIGERLSSSPPSKFIIGTFLSFYFLTIRPELFSQFNYYVAVYEWVIVCIITWRIYADLKQRLKIVTEPLSTGDWIKHHQLVEIKGDKDLKEVSGLVENFISMGDKGGILTYLICMMAKNQIREDDIFKAVAELIYYEDLKIPRLAFAWDIRRIEMENKEMRIEVLSRVIMNVKWNIFGSP